MENDDDPDRIRQFYIESAYVNFGYMTTVLLYSCFYLVSKVVKLVAKQFHALMFTAFLLTTATQFTLQSLKLDLAFNFNTLPANSRKRLYNMYADLSQVYFCLDVMIHTVFVNKYWALSKQL